MAMDAEKEGYGHALTRHVHHAISITQHLGDRCLASIVGVFGAYLLMKGTLAFIAIRTVDSLAANEPPADPERVAHLQQVLGYISAGCLLFGAAAVAAAVGLFRHKAWAEGLWFGLIVVFAGYVAASIFTSPEDWMRYTMDVLIVVVSITVLSARKRHRRAALPSST